MTDIAERLKQLGSDMGEVDRETCNEAVKEIERLRADNERLRAQVKGQRAALAQIMAPRYPDARAALQDARDIARTALEGKDD